MAQEGPLLASVRRLVSEMRSDQIGDLPAAPLPVALWEDPDQPGLRVDLQVTLGGDSPGEMEAAMAALRERGLRVTTSAGSAVVGWAYTESLNGLVQVDCDVLIEAAPAVRPALDLTVPEAWHLASPMRGKGTGEGVVVGIIDSGIDVTHPDFIDPSGQTRILKLWDQRVHGAAPQPAAGYGSEWDATAINAYLASGTAAPFVSVDPTGHGTGVAGIAAGNGRGSPGMRYRGVAEAADLIVVGLGAKRKALPSSARVVAAAKYIFNEAEALGRRAVVNLSLGSGIGPHDPNGQFELAITKVLADKQRVLIASAGNEATEGRHCQTPLVGGSVTIEVDVPAGVGPYVLVDIWYDKSDFLDVSVVDPSGNASPLVVAGDQDVGSLGQDRYEIDSVLDVLEVGDNHVQVKLLGAMRRGDVSAGRWQLQLHPSYVTSGRDAQAWLDVGLYRSPAFVKASSACTVTSPATADGIVAVGSYAVAPTLGPLAPSSGRGPDRHGRPLTMLTAPGTPVCTSDGGPGAGGLYAARSGTSYAAPHVTGATAVLLESNPLLTRAQVITCLRIAARTDADTATGPLEGWGAGKLDISAALRCAAHAYT